MAHIYKETLTIMAVLGTSRDPDAAQRKNANTDAPQTQYCSKTLFENELFLAVRDRQ